MDLAYFEKVKDKFEAKSSDFRRRWHAEQDYRIPELFDDFETLLAVMVQDAYEQGRLDGYSAGIAKADERRGDGEWL